MSENVKKEPDIRFEGFVDDWEERKFDDSFSFPVSTNSLSRAMLNYDSGEVKSIHYGDILIKYPSILDIRREEIPFITSGTLEKYKENILVNGDLIFADAAEDETVGKAVEIHGITDEYIVSGLHTIVARASQQNAKYFLGYYINSDNYHRQLLRLIQGSKVSAISKGNLQKTQVTFPKEYEEQLKIGYFFKQLDNTITLHQQKLELLKKTKKGYLQKMFPKNGETVPEIRFEGFMGDWSKLELKELCSVTTGFPFKSSDFDENGKYLVITNANIQDDKSTVNSCIGNRINIEFNEDLSKYILNIGDILVTMDGTVGRTAKVDKHEQILAQRVGRLSAFENGEFLYQYLNNGAFSKAMLGLSHGGTIKHISLQEIESFMMIVPSAKEQVKIGNFFKTLDEIVDMEEKTLKELKSLKKSLLQKMFI